MPHHRAQPSRSKTKEATWSAEAVANQAKGPSAPTQLQATQPQINTISTSPGE